MEKIIEERRKEVERLAKIAFSTAKFNGKVFLNDYHEEDFPVYSPDSINSWGYEYQVVERNLTGKRICTNYITINGKLEIEWLSGRTKYQKETIKYDLDEVLKDEKLYNKLINLLSEPFYRYYFKADDIISGKVYTLRPENSNVSEYIEEFLYKFADALSEGIPANCEVWYTAGVGSIQGIKPGQFFWDASNGYTVTFKNPLLPCGTEDKESCLIDILKECDLNAIFNRPLSKIPDIPNNELLMFFIKELTPNMLAEWTNCLGPEATRYDFCKVIKFMANYRTRLAWNEEKSVFEYNSGSEAEKQAIKLNEELENRGNLFENWVNSKGVKKS